MRLLGGGGDDGGQGVAQLFKLTLSRGVEQRQRAQVDGVVGILGVDGDGGAGRCSLAAVADADGAEEVLGVSQVGLNLGAAEALATLGLGLLLSIRVELGFGSSAGSLVLGDAIGLGLLVGLGLGEGLGLGLGSLALLLALYLGIFGGIPRVKDLVRGWSSVGWMTLREDGQRGGINSHRCHPLRRRTGGGGRRSREVKREGCCPRSPRRLGK